jgi:hypothetical protein
VHLVESVRPWIDFAFDKIAIVDSANRACRHVLNTSRRGRVSSLSRARIALWWINAQKAERQKVQSFDFLCKRGALAREKRLPAGATSLLNSKDRCIFTGICHTIALPRHRKEAIRQFLTALEWPKLYRTRYQEHRFLLRNSQPSSPGVEEKGSRRGMVFCLILFTRQLQCPYEKCQVNTLEC